MENVSLTIHLTLKGPLLTQSSNPGELGLDLVVARHSDGTPYLPGSLITGKLRQALEELNNINTDTVDWFAPKLDQWLGKISQDYHPTSKQLYFTDFDLTESPVDSSSEIRDRITINKETGAVEPRQIVMIENPFTSGKLYTFSGKLHFFTPREDSETLLKHIKTGFNWMTQLGSMKSIGFGQVEKVQFSDLRNNPLSYPAKADACDDKISLLIQPTYPFCIAIKPVTDNNLFRSAAIIPGGAILGSIATTWNQLLGKQNEAITADHDPERKTLAENFSRLRITHAFPTKNDQRPLVAPLSLVKIDDEKLYDVAQLSKPVLIQSQKENQESSPEPPNFSLDWKDTADTLKEYPWPYCRLKNWGWASLNSELRVRTAIDRSSHRSKKGELFAYEQINPENNNWYTELDLTGIEQNKRPKVLAELKSLLAQGIAALGKTKTPAKVQFEPNLIKPIFDSSTEPNPDNQWIITLQTDTLLGTPELLNTSSGETDLREMYENTWKQLSSNKLKLIRYFARQKFSGGRQRRAVFQRENDPYRPWLLTEAGSVFVVEATDQKYADDAQALIKQWLNSGIPLTGNQFSYYGITENETEQWKNCPFIPQNGYGEIAVNIETGKATEILTDTSSNIIKIERVEN